VGIGEERIVHEKTGQDKIVRDKYDVVIVGGGSAGSAAGLLLARARHTVLVIEPDEAEGASVGHEHGGHVSHSEVRAHGGEVIVAKIVAAGADVVLADGRTITARRWLRIPTAQLPAVPGLAERWGRDVLHCPHCHGWEIRDQAIGVLATDETAVDQALQFRQWSADVTLFLHTGPEPSNAQWRHLSARDIGVVDGEVVGLEIEQDRLVGVQLRSGPVLARQALVVTPQLGPKTQNPLEAALALSAELIAEDIERAVAGHPVRDPFSAEAERHVHTRVLGHRDHGI
jgi:thioredoxin reductase